LNPKIPFRRFEAKTTLPQKLLLEVTIFVPSHYRASLGLSRIRKQANQIIDKGLMAWCGQKRGFWEIANRRGPAFPRKIDSSRSDRVSIRLTLDSDAHTVRAEPLGK
jgi:hypothetical protein